MTTFTTTIASTGSSQSGSVRVRQSGTLKDADFTTTLVQALQAVVTTGLTFDGVDKLTFTTAFAGPIVITRTTVSAPATGATHALQFFEATTGIDIPQATIAKVVGTPTLPTLPSMLKGVNLSGMEFSRTAFVPTNATIDYLFGQGFNCIRMPVLWQRMQPTLFGTLDTNGSTGLADKYKASMNYVLSKGMVCIVDGAHNYGSRPEGKVGSAAVPVTALDDYWTKMFAFLGSDPKIVFDLMNEPPNAGWGAMASSSTAALRAAGCLNRIHAYGTASAISSIIDPLNNVVLDVHKYLDPTMAGVSGVCTVGGGSSRLTDVTAAATAAGRRLFLGEFAAGYPTVAGQEQCATELPALIDAVQGSPSVWAGWTAWGGGRNWTTDYVFRLEYGEGNTADTPYMALLKTRLP
ncbi:cellulase family glycosylhydrolase [Pseudomonas huanghezhanensis]|uniref:cellulase family glycosylhydrolase n=1 Tax=Pseudomonas huanghezhanensis TaxID=3002903 RepID=UPI0022868CBD|nr:cellulase family glycosylhydrolase [Pseudomonas sp. BSw22131]